MRLRDEIALVLAKWLGETGQIAPQFVPIAADIAALIQERLDRVVDIEDLGDLQKELGS